MQLRNNYTFRTIDNERTVSSHVGNLTKEHVLNDSVEIFVIRVRTVQFKFRLQRHTIGKPSLQTLINRVAGSINVVVEELEYKVVARVSNGEVLSKHLVKTIVLTKF